ncbi:MAG: hypothetical protein AAF316_16135 [Cyanobacteria bacterium P01_A01_bin.80]
MFTIDLTVRNTAFPASIQRKTQEDAKAVYDLVLSAMRSNNPDIIELECEGKVEKKIAIRASEISGIQMTQKDGAASGSGKTPGFFALASE